MKNTIKRALLLIPVISVLLVALAVPAFADYSPGTGWSEPVGTFEPIYNVPMYFDYSASSFGQSITGSVGVPFEYDGNQIYFKYKLIISPKSDRAFNQLPLYDNTNGYCLAANETTDQGGYILGQSFGSYSDSYIYIDDLDGTRNYLAASSSPVVLYLTDYPFSGSVDELVKFNFEVYEVTVPSPVEPVVNVWTGIMTWITSALNSVMGAFYVDGSLTLLGTLAVIGVSVGIGFLLIGIIQRFLKLRG